MAFKDTLKKIWQFIWYDDSIWSWLANIALAFLIIKFIVYPGLGLIFGTSFPIVAVVSGSMQHDGNFDAFWSQQNDFYDRFNITKEQFQKFHFTGGFNKGDVMVVFGSKPENLKTGDVIVFSIGRPDPIIHRVVQERTVDGKYYFQTKGDHNPTSLNEEINTPEDKVIGKAVFRIPFLGWVKIIFVDIISTITGGLQ